MKNPAATASFMREIAAARSKLAALTALTDDHLNFNPDAINWAHEGDAAELNAALTAILAQFANVPSKNA